jgi:hypothetical protein
MKKLLVFLIVVGILGGGAWLLYTKVLMTPEKRTCGRLAELCGEKRRPDGEKCVEGMEKLRKAIGNEAYGKAVDCIDRATSCMGAMGCVAGGGLRGLGDFLEGMLDGVGDDLQKKGKELMDKLQKKLQKDDD